MVGLTIVKCKVAEAPTGEKLASIECEGKEYNPFTDEVQRYKVVRFVPANSFKCYRKLIELHGKAVGKPRIDDMVLYSFICTPRSMIKHELKTFTGRSTPTNYQAMKRLLDKGILFDTLMKTKGNKEVIAPPELVEDLCDCSYRDFITHEEYEGLTEDDVKRFVESLRKKE